MSALDGQCRRWTRRWWWSPIGDAWVTRTKWRRHKAWSQSQAKGPPVKSGDPEAPRLPVINIGGAADEAHFVGKKYPHWWSGTWRQFLLTPMSLLETMRLSLLSRWSTPIPMAVCIVMINFYQTFYILQTFSRNTFKRRRRSKLTWKQLVKFLFVNYFECVGTRFLDGCSTWCYKWDGMGRWNGFLWVGVGIEQLTVLLKHALSNPGNCQTCATEGNSIESLSTFTPWKRLYNSWFATNFIHWNRLTPVHVGMWDSRSSLLDV